MGFYGERAEDEAPGDWSPAEEIADVRRRLREGLVRRPDDVRLLMRRGEALVRAAVAEHRLSPRASRELAANMSALLESLGGQILPADG